MEIPIIFSEKCLDYGPEHIEGPERVKEAAQILKERGYGFLEPEPVSEKDLLSVHEADYVEGVKRGAIEDADTPAYKNIYEYARLSAGGAVLAAKVGGFSLMRPPGHHAGKRGSALGASTRGFCYFNNTALAVKRLKKPALILDIDGHHGNGTEGIFFGDPNIFFISLHRFPEYPGTGFKSRGNCFNFPLKPDCGAGIYLKTLDEALRKINLKEIEAVAVSAGFDAHKGDLVSLGLDSESFLEIGKRIARLKKPTFFVLEGGYVGEDVGNDADALLKGFTAASNVK